MAEKKKILYIVEAMGGGVFTYIVDLANIPETKCLKNSLKLVLYLLLAGYVKEEYNKT